MPSHFSLIVSYYDQSQFNLGFINQLDGKYSERVRLPTKARFGGFCCQHLPHLLLEV